MTPNNGAFGEVSFHTKSKPAHWTVGFVPGAYHYSQRKTWRVPMPMFQKGGVICTVFDMTSNALLLSSKFRELLDACELRAPLGDL